MPLLIEVPDEVVLDPDMMSLGQVFRAFGGTNVPGVGCVIYHFDPNGENKFTPDAYATCKINGCRMISGEFYTIVPASKLAELVPVGFPESSKDGVQRTWDDYVPFKWLLPDGTYLLRCLHFAPGETSSVNGLLDEWRILWEAEFGTLLTKPQGIGLIP